ncbi:aminotransferase class V-fold PLP-dependent enzyme [Pantoea sp. 18069]|uniref:aminotransferase class V-fold PLP-dependent enzyme n=1 Tax=Pantoea sp. 18069 TaxID=2681415 RepID=UPI00135C7B14|nr:aminotransferase class V-fold PLP-dependent enzyme [Pantoea sp. 18069]
MEIYLDANATTAVFPPARQAALAVMADSFGNPSSIHGSGLKARAVVEQVRASARRVLGAPSGQLFFTSGATEGIQTSVLSALCELRRRRDAGEPAAQVLLYGATEHKAVPQALHHWNALLGLNLPVLTIPVDRTGRHDLAWLRQHAATAGLVCTMAANNETGVISDLDAIAEIVGGSPALWLVDGVQALGKLPLKLVERRIDYAPFSGHKFYAPKGIGLLYVRAGAPFTPLLTGGGQEDGLRGGTENIAGIAALGAVLQAWEAGDVFQAPAALAAHRAQLVAALRAAFPGLVFNAGDAPSLPTTLNFAVRGVSSRLLLDLFDAADLRVSGGSACSAARAEPSYVLQAMGLDEWQTQAAVRLSFGALDSPEFIAAACARLQRCGEVLRARGLSTVAPAKAYAPPLVTRLLHGSACSYLLADGDSGECIVIDPVMELVEPITRWLGGQQLALRAVLGTGDGTAAAARQLREATGSGREAAVDAQGWPADAVRLALGAHELLRLPGVPDGRAAWGLRLGAKLRYALVGDLLDVEPCAGVTWLDDWQAHGASPETLLLPRHDAHGLFATTLASAGNARPLAGGVAENTEVALDRPALARLQTDVLWVDVREAYERDVQVDSRLIQGSQSVPLSGFVSALPQWLELAPQVAVVFYCRSGNRSAQAARALRRLGHMSAWSLAGGLAMGAEPLLARVAESVAHDCPAAAR